MIKKLGEEGYTIGEVMFVLFWCAVATLAIYGIVGLAAGNFWFGEESALKAVQFEDPLMTEIVKFGHW